MVLRHLVAYGVIALSLLAVLALVVRARRRRRAHRRADTIDLMSDR